MFKETFTQLYIIQKMKNIKRFFVKAEIIDGRLLILGNNDELGYPERYPVCFYGKDVDEKTIGEIKYRSKT